MAPRREAVRQHLTAILLESGLDPRPSRDDILGRVHDLCAKELAERVRIAAGELKRAYASPTEGATDILLEDLQQEIGLVITGEMADLVDDERLAALLLKNLPRFLPEPRLSGF